MTDNPYLDQLAELKRQKAEMLELALKERDELPHLYLYKNYTWGRKFIDSMNKRNVLCAANQLSKSSTMIRRFITRATSPEMWALWYPKLASGQAPTPFWYGYPSFPVATQEFDYKWKQFLPKGAMKDDPRYGWSETIKNGYISKISFNSGVDVVFKAYKQSPDDLQSGSVWEMGLDEEPPEELMSELEMRLNATGGYFNSAFTATKGQEFWRQIVEEKTRWAGEDGQEPAFVQQVSLQDSQFYEDGSPSPWDEAKIKRAISLCSSEAQVQRRVYGKFIVDEGLKYQGFDKGRNTCAEYDPKEFPLVYAGLDYGSGGTAHPSAITFVAVDSGYSKARVIKCWRGDGIDTSAEDVVKKYLEMARGLNVTVAYYDWAAKDLATIAGRLGLTFQKAEKSHDVGEMTLNTLLKSGALKICTGGDKFWETEKLVTEIMSLLESTNKNSAKDDLVDSFRYAASSVPWDWEVITNLKELERPRELTKYEIARPNSIREDSPAAQPVEEELDYWDSLMV